jgi:hypothetical protein
VNLDLAILFKDKEYLYLLGFCYRRRHREMKELGSKTGEWKKSFSEG